MTSESSGSRPSRGLGYFLLHPWNKVRWTLEAARWRRDYGSELARARESAIRGPLDVVLVLDHLKPRNNPAMLVRSADALGAREVRTVGMPYFNVRPSVGSIRNLPLVAHQTIEACFASLRSEGYQLVALEPARNLAERRYLDATALPSKCALIVGHEKHGISFRPEDHPDVLFVAIRQFGRVPCMNVAMSGSVALYEYARQHGPRTDRPVAG